MLRMPNNIYFLDFENMPISRNFSTDFEIPQDHFYWLNGVVVSRVGEIVREAKINGSGDRFEVYPTSSSTQQKKIQ
jgi:hypothetical protein